MSEIFKTYFPYLVCFILGVLVAWQGCGGGKVKTETVTIEKPVPVVEYVDRWKYDTIRFAEWRTVHDTVHDTVHEVKYVNTYDSVLVIDTVKILESWLTEITKYDTTASFETADVRLRWQNYQNVSENLVIDYLPKRVPLKWALGVHANAGLISDFRTQYTPLFGLGLQASLKKNYIAADYGFNGQHYVGLRYGRNIIQR